MTIDLQRTYKRILNPDQSLKLAGCNCQGGEGTCVVGGHCKTRNVVYEATVRFDEVNPNTHRVEAKEKKYNGLCSTTFKERYNGHKGSFRHEHREKETTLSTLVWKLKRSNPATDFDLSWKIARFAPAYSKESRKCHLCLTEKTLILFQDPQISLNRRTELHGHCHHYARHRLELW